MKIDNAQLAAFSAVIHEGSFDAAARCLNVTSSAISQRVKLLEERLGQVLILRGSPCQPTQTGKTLLRFSEQLDLLENELFRDLGVFGGEEKYARISVVVNADSLDGWFLQAMEKTCRDGGISLDLRVEDQEHSATLLREGEVMAAVSASAAPIQGCRVEYLGDMRYLALASPAFVRDHFAAGVDAASLNRAPMLVFSRKDSLQQTFAEMLAMASVSPPVHYLPSTRGFIEVARLGLGWGMIPEDMAKAEIEAGELVEISPGRHLNIPLYWHCWRFSSPTLEKLSAAVRDAAGVLLCRGMTATGV